MVSNEQALVTQLSNQRQAVSGVSLDQEATDLIRFQQAYDAAAQYISAVNSTITTMLQNVR